MRLERMPTVTNNPLDFSRLLSRQEQVTLAHPERWRWISSVASDVKAVHRPEHLEWAREHSHSPAQRELFLSLSGNTLAVLRDKVYSLKPGVVILFNSGERHNRDAAPIHFGVRHLWLHTENRHAISSNLNEIDKNGVRTDTKLKLLSGNNANLMMEAWNRCQEEPGLSVHWAFLKTLITASFFEALSDWKNDPKVSPHKLIIDSIQDHIQNHLHEDLTLHRLADLAGYSPYFFHRIFLKYAGKPVHHYVVEARLKYAKSLLQQGQSIISVCEAIGMESPSYFSRFFKKHTMLTASDWRLFHQAKR